MSDLVEKVCPYVLRGSGAKREILSFRHPLAGWQLVKGTREPGESVEEGALRELVEEAGVVGFVTQGPHWVSAEIAPAQLWHFVPVAVPDLPDQFDFDTLDDAGHRFSFFWWPLAKEPGDEWHPYFVRSLSEIRARV